MKIALVTTAPSVPSPVGVDVRRIVPHLGERSVLALFVEGGTEGGAIEGLELRSVRDFDPQAFDQVVYALGNERAHGFMTRLVREIGGTVVLEAWQLAELALGARPELARGGARGLRAAWLEGGFSQARRYARGERAGDLALNRSIVRYADAFLVSDPELKRRILVERNAPTPIEVVARDAERPDLVAGRWLEHLESFPAPHARRRSLIKSLIEASDLRRAESEAT